MKIKKKPKLSHRKVTGDVIIPCNYYKRPTKPVGKMVDGVLVTIQPEKLEKCCIAFQVEYYPEEREKKELCDSDDFKKCKRYMMRHSRKPIKEK